MRTHDIEGRVSALEAALLSITRAEFWDESQHPRDERGRFGEGDGSEKSYDAKNIGSVEFNKAVDNMPHSTEEIRAQMRENLKLVQEGEKVIIAEPHVATLLDELHNMIQEAKASGSEFKEINLCNVSVEGTNYFCEGNLGVPRLGMPQLSADASKLDPDSPAASFPVNDRGEVELVDHFVGYLKEQGVKVEDDQHPAGLLRATQSELQSSKVDNLIEPTREGKLTGAIFVSNDGYVLDGHHRWAAQVEADILDGKFKGDSTPINVTRIDMPMNELLPLTIGYTQSMGMPQVGIYGETKK